MKWFDSWLNKRIRQIIDDENSSTVEDAYSPIPGYNTISKVRRSMNPIVSTSSDSLNSHGVCFTLYNANGGYVIELRDYDPHTERHKNSLHVIPNGGDLGKALEHIITLEALKK